MLVFSPVSDWHATRQRGVDRAVPIAGPVDRLLDQLPVGVAVPRAVERDLDLVEGLRPLLVPVALDLHLERAQRLLELLQQQDGVQARAAAQGAEEHLGRPHRRVVAEDRRLVDLSLVSGFGLDVKQNFAAGPGRGCLRHRTKTYTWR